MRQEVTGSAWSSAVRRWRLGHCGGRWERTSDVDAERESAGGQKNPSGRKGSGGGREWECAGGVEEKETCRDRGLSSLMIQKTGPHHFYLSTDQENDALSVTFSYLQGGESSAGVLWDETLGEGDFFLVGGDVALEGDDTLPERSSDVIDRLALCELSDRSL